MPKGPKRWLHALFALSLLGAGAMAVETWQGVDGLPKRRALQADLQRVAEENDALEKQVERLRREVIAQKERPQVQEALVRDVLGYVRSGEVVLQPRQ